MKSIDLNSIEALQKYTRENKLSVEKLGKFIDSSPRITKDFWKTIPGTSSFTKAECIMKNTLKQILYEIY